MRLEASLQLSEGINMAWRMMVMNVDVDTDDEVNLIKDVRARSNACYKCGEMEHFQRDCKYDGDKPMDGQQEQDGSFDSYDPVVGKWITNLVATTPITAKAMKSLYAELNRQKDLKRTYRRRYKDLQAVVATTSDTPAIVLHPTTITSSKVTPNIQVSKTTSAGQQKKTPDKGKAKPIDKGKKNVVKTTPNMTAGSSANLQSQLRDKAKHTAALIQEITEELQAIEEESLKEDQDSDATRESDLEQEDSDNTLTESEQWLCEKLETPICDNKSSNGTEEQDKNKTFETETSEQDINHMEEVIIGMEQGTTFPTKIGTSVCNALIDTGATKSCISEKYYQQLPSTKIQCLKNISVKSATGSNLTPLGMINCLFKLGKIRFNSNLIICKNLTRPLILGRDFLMQNHITVWYAEDGKCILDYQHELIASINVEDKPQLNMTHSVTLPGRALVIVCIYNNLDPNQSRYIYEIEPSGNLNEKYPNLCVIPMIHNEDVHKTEHIPLVVINFASDEIYLSKGETMGFMQIQSLDISEIMTETSTEPSSIIFEDDNKEVPNKQEGETGSENTEKRFITSPTDIEVHRKVKLQDANTL